MAYEVFEKKTTRLGTPVMSISKLGSLTFNQTASRQFQKLGVKTVLLMWDSEARKIALKKISDENDPRSYVMRYNDKGNGSSFSAKTFLDYAGIDYSQRKPIAIEISPNKEFLIEVQLPDSLFSKREEPQEAIA